MRIEIQQIIIDIKAAARIGHAESMWTALNGLLEYPEVIGNPHIPDPFLTTVVLPIGKALIHPRLSRAALRQLLNQPDAVLRAIGAVVFAHFYITDKDSTDQTLKIFSQDPRPDVRKALSMRLSQGGQSAPEKIRALVTAWIAPVSPRAQGVALQILPATQDTAFIFESLANFTSIIDPELREILSETLATLAENISAEQVLVQLTTWAESNTDYLWVSCKTLSRAWAANHAESALNILTQLGSQSGPHKQI
ncbi:MAG: hypothetical protein N2D54_02455, partial [Chloroflexota bacterium]